MASWDEFSRAAPDLAEFGAALFRQHGIAYLATVRPDGGPRLHPITPIFAQGRLYAAIGPDSPKLRDLRRDGRYALHAPLGESDAEFVVRGRATEVVDGPTRARAIAAASFAVVHGEVLFEFAIELALTTVWENVGQPDTRPIRRRWSADAMH